MCGSYSLIKEENNEELFKIIQTLGVRYPDRSVTGGEVFPGNEAPILRLGDTGIEPDLGVWGFPTLEKKPLLLYVPSETVLQKNNFRPGLLSRRCVIPSTGFYEWPREGTKEKRLFRMPEDRMLYMAGIYHLHEGERRYVILTAQGNESVREIQERMPLVLPKDQIKNWIQDTDRALELLQKAPPLLECVSI